MTGPEHYKQAERLLQPKERYFNGGQTRSVDPPAERDVARATAHAILALAAAAAVPHDPETKNAEAWIEVTS